MADMLEEIKRIIWDETKYMRHYYGTVLNNVDVLDPKSGAVTVLCDELGWSDPTSAGRCLPRFMHSMSVPNIFESVEIYFQNGDAENPRYMAQAQDILGNIPLSYNLPTTHVIFESPLLKQYIKVDDLTGTITINPAIFIKLGLGIESMIKGTTALVELTKHQIAITALQAAISAWTPVLGDGGAALKIALAAFLLLPMPNYASILSLKHFLD